CLIPATGRGARPLPAAPAGLVSPATDPSSPHTVDLAQLVANPTQAIAAVHRAALLDSNHHWGHLLGEVAGLLGMPPASVTGTGTMEQPWVIALAPAGPLTLELAAWDAQTVAADPHRK